MSDGAQEVSPRSEPEAPPAFWRAPVEFAVHAIVGSCIFGIIAAAAVLPELGLHKLKDYGIDRLIIFGLEAAEYSLFVTDLLLFMCFLWRAAKRTLPKL